jgi:hypothetical protein
MNRSYRMRTVVAALATAIMLIAVPAHAAVDAAASGGREYTPSSAHEKNGAQTAHGAMTPGQTKKERRPHGAHHHRIAAIVIYVPAYGTPYYYAPPIPGYVDQDPPDYAYQEPNGFYYWCPDPAGYYPDQQDCPIGWRLVAP